MIGRSAAGKFDGAQSRVLSNLSEDGRFTHRQPSTVRIFLRSRLVLLGLLFCLPMGLVGVFAPIVIPYDPMVIDVQQRFRPPSLSHPMGTDNFGRDILSRVLVGARISYQVGAGATLLSLIVGALLGASAAFFGGMLDRVLMRVLDAIIAFPGILIALVLVAILGSGLTTVIIAVALILLPVFARAVRASVLVEREKLYVEAARCVGSSEVKVLFRHVMPNVISPTLVLATSTFAIAILIEASLSFLGMGVVPPDVSWGTMLSESRGYLERYPWAPIFPGVAITLSVLGLNLLGDGLRDFLDPRLRNRV